MISHKKCHTLFRNIELDLVALGDTLLGWTGEIVKFLEPIVDPTRPLAERLGGISDIMGQDITVLSIAEQFLGEESGYQTVIEVRCE
jgi:hypothetical protein